MGFTKIRKIPSPEEILDMVPLTENLKKIKSARDAEIEKVVTQNSDKFILIVGPCSADEEDPVCEYVSRLAKVQEKVKNEIIIIPRIYTNKPRTNGEGYKGMLHQPDPQKEPDMVGGILSIRRMHVRAISESGLTAADEMLYPDNLPYCEDMLSYIAIGARSVENQQHRLTSSGISIPVGMKNPTSGDLTVMYNSINAAQVSHTFSYQNYEVKTEGNPLSHAIMRGYVNKHGENQPNYHYEDLLFASEMYEKKNLQNPMIIVDTNHANSNKKFFEQIRIAKEILYSRSYNQTIKKYVRGLMIESYIHEGNHSPDKRIPGKSITDPCLGWEDTERLIYYIAEHI
ncbi:3-deoxy-7-phosphoheptulonate synthase [Anaeropeptidivorans aminofermentans]|jgi:3-deoxy-7-phosphoheptulonate synthase|uniref:3-deoxy-7-phosphoheptulonate synthase n=1 Tax=Anaeropeptidivorans aminofermentans TaxID=2934315 RepID=UPI0020243022|nr:3-deoxy-7-phosphoheptulonate synthase [Anaeropeptidivorans aminofermentans]